MINKKKFLIVSIMYIAFKNYREKKLRNTIDIDRARAVFYTSFLTPPSFPTLELLFNVYKAL